MLEIWIYTEVEYPIKTTITIFHVTSSEQEAKRIIVLSFLLCLEEYLGHIYYIYAFSLLRNTKKSLISLLFVTF